MKPREWIAIVGSRDFANRDRVERYIGEMALTAWDSGFISGGARGVDTWAANAIRECGLILEVIPADWKTHGKAAGPIRNTTIVERCDRVVAFWDGKSRGTLDTIRKAVRAGKPVEIFPEVEAQGDVRAQ